MNDALSFYKNLSGFQSFDCIVDDEYFVEPPEDWIMYVTDVEDSTEAIQKGSYRDVNKVGAAAVSLCQNVIGSLNFPFAFNGDGMTVLVPPIYQDDIQHKLSGLKQLTHDRFDLQLHVGGITIADLKQQDVTIEVAKYMIKDDLSIGVFRGNGAAHAEKMIRQNPETYGLAVDDPPSIDLQGLSCRWKPISPNRDAVLSLLVLARTNEHSTYRHILRQLSEEFAGELAQANPVNNSSMSYQTIAECIHDEKRYHTSLLSFRFLTRCLEIVLAVLFFRWGIPPLFFDAASYQRSLSGHSDFRKFDDMLRMTLDCTEEQIQKIDQFLSNLHAEGTIFYGIHRSDASLMTCFVEDLSDGNHIHFIDGSDGGYAMASIQLKRQIDEATSDHP